MAAFVVRHSFAKLAIKFEGLTFLSKQCVLGVSRVRISGVRTIKFTDINIFVGAVIFAPGSDILQRFVAAVPVLRLIFLFRTERKLSTL